MSCATAFRPFGQPIPQPACLQLLQNPSNERRHSRKGQALPRLVKLSEFGKSSNDYFRPMHYILCVLKINIYGWGDLGLNLLQPRHGGSAAAKVWNAAKIN
jgi:hypothetical protein